MILRTQPMFISTFSLLLCIYIQNTKFVDCRAVVFTEERSPRLIREIYPEEVTAKQAKANYCLVGDVVYATGEAVGSSDPCEKCECRGPGVQCSPMQCPPPNPGCRALHRPDICCPSYQCECTFGNRTYANGERLEDNPNGPCKVCYCRGGEIQCNDVGCYTRDDCEPVQVPGQCCPKYDNCPPRDHVSSSTEPFSSASSETLELNESDTGRIRSDEIISSSNESGPQITSFEDVTRTSERIPGQSAEIQESSTKGLLDAENQPILKETPVDSQPKITIKEVIAPPKREINVANNKYNENVDSSAKSKEEEGKNAEIDNKNEYPESETYEHPASVIRVGNDVIIYEGGQIKPGHDLSSTPASFINVIGAEGLQIGGVDDVQNDHFHNFGSSTEEAKISSSEATEKYPSTENLTYLKESEEIGKMNTDDIYKESQEKVMSSSITSVKKQLIDPILDEQLTSEGPTRIPISFETYSSTSNVDEDLILESSMKHENQPVSESESPLPVLPLDKSKDENTENISERNPAYPPLPDEEDVLLSRPQEEDIDAYKASHIEHPDLQSESNNPLINAKAALPLSLLNSPTHSDLVDGINEEEILSSTAANEITSKSDDSKILFTSEMFEILNYIANATEEAMKDSDNKTLETSSQDYSDLTTVGLNEVSTEGLIIKTALPEAVLTESALIKSKESLEEIEDSGEQVTEKTQLSSFMPFEDASLHHNSDSSSKDVELLTGEPSNKDDNSASEQKSAEIIDPSNNNDSYQLKDVEVFSPNGSEEHVTKANEMLQNNSYETDGSGFSSSQLSSVEDDQQNAASNERETTSSVEVIPFRTSQENELLMKVSDAISKFKLHESTDSLDINVLNILKDFLDKQSKSYK